MTIDILTLFPEMFVGPLEWSIVKRAQDKHLMEIRMHDLRAWATDKYKSVDDRPYGGGAGMIMRVDVVDRAVDEIKKSCTVCQLHSCTVVLLDAGGEKYSQAKAEVLAKSGHLVIVCGHYEGVDHRVHEHIANEVISIGDYVLSGGEIPAMVIVDSVVRLLPGVLGNPQSLVEESFTHPRGVPQAQHHPGGEGGEEYPQYTRPEEYKCWKVPEILLSGDHKKIQDWRKNTSSK